MKKQYTAPEITTRKAMSPMLSYPGGKQRIASQLLSLLPKHSVYVEPFAGGAALLFAKPRVRVTNGADYREVLNDLNGDVVNFYRVMSDEKLGPKAVNIIQNTLFSFREFKEAREKSQSNNKIERAVAFYVLSQQSFGSVVEYTREGVPRPTGWRRSINTRNDATTWENKLEELPQKLERLRGVYVDETSFEVCIEKWDSLETFFYCDPPYPDTGITYRNSFDVEDFQRLVDLLQTIKGKFMLSCYPLDVRVPSTWRIVDIEAQMSVAGQTKHAKRTELETSRIERVYMNYSEEESGREYQLNLFQQEEI